MQYSALEINVKQNETKKLQKTSVKISFIVSIFFFFYKALAKKKLKKAILIIAQLLKICITSWKKPHDMLSSIWHNSSAEEKRSH